LKAKLAKSEEARKIQQALFNNGAAISQEIIRITGYLAPVQKLADTQGGRRTRRVFEFVEDQSRNAKNEAGHCRRSNRAESPTHGRLLETPTAFSTSLKILTQNIQAKPDQTAIKLFCWKLGERNAQVIGYRTFGR
jgi:hypothetical protein